MTNKNFFKGANLSRHLLWAMYKSLKFFYKDFLFVYNFFLLFFNGNVECKFGT